MKFTISTILAFAAAVLAQPKLTNSNFDVVEGQPFTITWMDAQGPVTLTLKHGDPKNLKDVTVITSGVTGEEFTWTPSNLPSDTYAIEITDSSGVPNYSTRFTYEGTGTVSSASSSIVTSTVMSTITSKASSSSTAASSTPSSESSSSSESSTHTTHTTSTSTRAAPTTLPTNQNSEGQRFSSPLALLIVTVAAVMYFH